MDRGAVLAPESAGVGMASARSAQQQPQPPPHPQQQQQQPPSQSVPMSSRSGAMTGRSKLAWSVPRGEGAEPSTYFIPLDKAVKQINAMAAAMQDMKDEHLRIVDEVQTKWEEIESSTESYFSDFIIQLKQRALERHHRDKQVHDRLSTEYQQYKMTAQETVSSLQRELRKVRAELDREVTEHQHDVDRITKSKQSEVDSLLRAAERSDAKHAQQIDEIETEFQLQLKDLKVLHEAELARAAVMPTPDAVRGSPEYAELQLNLDAATARATQLEADLEKARADFATAAEAATAASAAAATAAADAATQQTTSTMQARIAELERSLAAAQSSSEASRSLSPSAWAGAAAAAVPVPLAIGAGDSGAASEEVLQRARAAEGRAKELEVRVAALSTENESLEDDLRSQRERLRELEAALDEARAESTSNTGAATEALEAQVGSLQKQLDIARSRNTQLEGEVSALQERVASLMASGAGSGSAAAPRAESVADDSAPKFDAEELARLEAVIQQCIELRTKETVERNQVKEKILRWEADFKQQNGRAPERDDKKTIAKDYLLVRQMKSRIDVADAKLKQCEDEKAKLLAALSNSNAAAAKPATESVSGDDSVRSDLAQATLAKMRLESEVSRLRAELATAQAGAEGTSGSAARVERLQSELESAREAARAARQERDRATDDADDARRAERKLAAEVDALRAAAADSGASSEEVTRLERELAQRTAHAEQLQSKLTLLAAAPVPAADAAADGDDETARLRSELARLRADIATRVEPILSNDEIRDLQDQVASLQDQVSSLEEQLANAPSSDGGQTLDDSQTAIDSTELAELRAKTSSLEEECDQLRTTADKLKADKARLTSKVSSLMEELGNAENKASSLEVSLRAARASITELQQEVIRLLDNRNERLVAAMKKANEELAKSTGAKLRSVQKHLADYQSEQQANTARMDALRKAIDDGALDDSAAMPAAASSSASDRALRERISELEAELEQVSAERDERAAEVVDLKNTVPAAGAPAARGSGASSAEVAQLKAKVAELTRENTQLKRAPRSSATAAAAPAAAPAAAAASAGSDARARELAKENKELQDRLRIAETKATKLETRLKSLEDAKSKATGDNKAVKEAEKKVALLESKLQTAEANHAKAMEDAEAKSQRRLELKVKELTTTAAEESARKDKDLELYKREVATKTDELGKALDQLQGVRRDLDLATRRSDELVAELEASKKAAGEALKLKSDLTEATKRLKEKTAEFDEINALYKKESLERKKLHNQIEEMKGNIRVFARARPLKTDGPEAEAGLCVTFPDQYTVEHTQHRNNREQKTPFEFTRVFDPQVSNAEIFEDTRHLVQSAVDGYNVCVFAYGQTGSGKTFTMYGPASNPGIAPRVIRELFDLREQQKHKTFEIKVYMVELYRDQLRDLLIKPSQQQTKLDIKLDGQKQVYIAGATVLDVTTYQQVLEAMATGSSHRKTASTKMNADSSRSHLVFSILLKVVDSVEHRTTVSKLSLIDLAGSEKQSKTGATNDTLAEAKSINMSLTNLGAVIRALAENSGHVPYRDNLLTRLMQDSLGNDAKTLMFVNMSPSSYNEEETKNSLLFASAAKKIVNRATQNVETKAVAMLKERVTRLESKLERARKGEPIDVSDDEEESAAAPAAS